MGRKKRRGGFLAYCGSAEFGQKMGGVKDSKPSLLKRAGCVCDYPKAAFHQNEAPFLQPGPVKLPALHITFMEVPNVANELNRGFPEISEHPS